ncbi:MAG: hypothetical protein KKH72_09685 [Alphaproteobacteria bacterium]|nr:hypothetical protein [Alphaproteobacteria bacterium]
MAIGNSKSVTGYTIGGKSLGVQLGQKSGTALFGDNVSATSLFSASLNASSAITIDATQIAVKGIQDQIDRIQGFRTNLTPAEKQQLTDYQETIVNINQTATTRILTDDEISERAEAYVESYRILGKEYVDFSNDDFVVEKSNALTELLATKPQGAEAKRLERLENVLTNLKASATDREGDPPATLIARITSVSRQIDQLTAARPLSTLSRAELREHDTLVDEINTHVGFDLELTSSKKLQIERLQKTIEVIQQGGALYA